MSIRASASACDITPEKALPLAGFSGMRRISEETALPLYASAVHIRGGAGGCILLSLDLWSLDPEAAASIRSKVSKATGTSVNNVFVTVTGCCSAPYTENALYLRLDPSFSQPDSDYMQLVTEQSVKAASEAAVSSKPASIAAIDLEAPGTGALIIKGDNGRVIAAVIVKDDIPDYLGKENRNISADFTGALRTSLSRRFGGEPVIAYIPNSCGNQIFETRKEYGISAAETAAKKLSDELISKLKLLKGTDFSSDCIISGSIMEIPTFPKRNLPQFTEVTSLLNTAKTSAAKTGATSGDAAMSKKDMIASIERKRMISIMIASKDNSLAKAINDYEPAIIQTISIGPAKIIGVPCSILRESALEMAKITATRTWLSNNTNGTLMGSILSCEAGDSGLTGQLFSPVFERDSAVQLLDTILKAGTRV